MTVWAVVIVSAGVFVAALVQTIGGFGFGLLAVALMTIAVDAHTAVIISTLTGTVSIVAQARRERQHAQWRLVKRFTIAAYVGMPLGLVAFELLGARSLQVALGVAVLAAVVFLARGFTLAEQNNAIDNAAGFVSGVLATSLSTNGPPLVFAMQARGLGPDAFRGTLAWVFGLCDIGSVGLFLARGKIGSDGLIGLAGSLPAIALGQYVGVRVRDRFEGERFRRLVFVLLIAAGLSAIVNALR